MRVEYNVKNKNSFKVFNDAMGVALNRENIIRGKKVKYLSYLSASILEIIIALMFLILMLTLTKAYYCTLSIVLVFIATLLFIFMILNILYPLLFASWIIFREENELEIDEKGISFYFDDDQYYTLGWTHIRALIIGKHSLNFITDDKFFFYFDKKYRNDILSAIKEYNESLLIIK